MSARARLVACLDEMDRADATHQARNCADQSNAMHSPHLNRADMRAVLAELAAANATIAHARALAEARNADVDYEYAPHAGMLLAEIGEALAHPIGAQVVAEVWDEAYDKGKDYRRFPKPNPYRPVDAEPARPVFTHAIDWNEADSLRPGWWVTTRRDGEAWSGMPLNIWLNRHGNGCQG
jgi:hypothetical protein